MIFLFLFLLPLVIALLTMPWLKKIAVQYKFVDIADEDELKIHKAPISYLGGAGMLLGIIGGTILAGVAYPHFVWQLVSINTVGVLVFAFGFWDDWKWKHITQRKPMQKLALAIVVQFAMAVVLFFAGVRPELFLEFIPPILVSFGAIFIVSNSMNLQDGMDGLAGTLAAISAIGFLTVSILSGALFSAVLAIVLLGAIIAFLRFNFPPASIFMGDSGAYLLGSLLAVLALLAPSLNTWVGFLGIIFLVGVPIFESFLSLGRRVLGGVAFFLGDRSHVYDILLKRGYPVRKVLAVFAGSQALSVAVGVLIIYSQL